jgi:hypothetical protein
VKRKFGVGGINHNVIGLVSFSIPPPFGLVNPSKTFDNPSSMMKVIKKNSFEILSKMLEK